MDWTPVIATTIATLPALLAWWEARKASRKSTENGAAIKDVHGLVNGQTITVNKLERAAGRLEGIAEQKVKDEANS